MASWMPLKTYVTRAELFWITCHEFQFFCIRTAELRTANSMRRHEHDTRFWSRFERIG
jgi:hypothetical protein